MLTDSLIDFFSFILELFLKIALDSPVSIDSLIDKLLHSIILASALTLSPDSK